MVHATTILLTETGDYGDEQVHFIQKLVQLLVVADTFFANNLTMRVEHDDEDDYYRSYILYFYLLSHMIN